MPVVQSAPYPTVTDALVAARVVCNDAAQSILGDILATTQPFVMPMCDLAHKTLRKMLTKAGVETLSAYSYCTGLTPVQTSDPTVQVRLTYTGYFDGLIWHGPTVTAALWNSATTYTQGMTVTYNGIYYVAVSNSGTNLNKEPDVTPSFWRVFSSIGPVLPSTMTEPLEIWERQTGSINRWAPMAQAADSISSATQTGRFRIWDWESDILYLPGATRSNDLKLKHLVATPRLTNPQQQIPIADCEMAMGALIAEILSASRGGQAAPIFHARAASEVDLLVSPSVRKGQYATYNRKPFRGTRASRRR